MPKPMHFVRFLDEDDIPHHDPCFCPIGHDHTERER